MKIWRLILVAALTVLALLPAPPAQSDWSDCYELTNPNCFQPGGDCEAFCECLGFTWGTCIGPYPGSCACAL